MDKLVMALLELEQNIIIIKKKKINNHNIHSHFLMTYKPIQ